MKTIAVFISFIFVLILTIQPIKAKAEEPNLIISEINFMGSLSATRCIDPEKINEYELNTSWCGKDEWIEIKNIGSDSVNLFDYKLIVRNDKQIELGKGNLLPGQNLVVGFTQKNFKSILPTADILAYNLLYFSKDSGYDSQQDNITAILKKGSVVVDSVISHPSAIDPEYKAKRGQSYYKCNRTQGWKPSTNIFIEKNYGTPGWDEEQCPKTNDSIAPLPPVEEAQNPEVQDNTYLNSNQFEEKVEAINSESANYSNAENTITRPVVIPKSQVEILNVDPRLSFKSKSTQKIFTIPSINSVSYQKYEKTLPITIQYTKLDLSGNRQFQAIFGVNTRNEIAILNSFILTELLIKVFNKLKSKNLKLKFIS